jgi:pyruvate kinase
MSPTPNIDRSRVGTRAKEIHALRMELDSLCAGIRDVTASSRAVLDAIPRDLRASAINLLHYLALRRHDLRGLQPRLSALGLSSLGRSEGCVLASVDAVCTALRALDGEEDEQEASSDMPGEPPALDAHTEALFGPEPTARRVRIMVTVPTEAAHDYTLVRNLVRSGMDCMRINCAHDEAHDWLAMIEFLRRASGELGRPCRVVMDLAGPKLRTGPLKPGAAVMKLRPERDVFGHVTAPARIWLTVVPGEHVAPSPCTATLPLPAKWLAQLRVGDTITFADARNARRGMKVVDVEAGGVWAELIKTSYLVPGTRLRRTDARGKRATAMVGPFAPRENPIVLRVGDTLIVNRSLEPGRPATYDRRGRLLTPASIGCTLPDVFDDVGCGDAIWFDDGTIGGVIEKVEPDRTIVRVNHAREQGDKLRGDKGINLPDSTLRLTALTAKDIEDLKFVVRHADLVSLSFANCAADVEQLQQHLKRLGGEKLGVILKVETRRGFENLPEMLFAALHSSHCGVMIARGDLAVECGFERLAEVQEEILWLCEAAHVPVIWATQVLENLAKDGFPSRAEITDAAMSERAECVMLNKGAHVGRAVEVLDNILRRMQEHVTKKRSMLRELKVASRYLGDKRVVPPPRAKNRLAAASAAGTLPRIRGRGHRTHSH